MIIQIYLDHIIILWIWRNTRQ